ncbi:bifunctional phosphopantothenoylcysteine decarboxylase/phosphopantothenate--cysteine ligase CoaBC [Lactobacillus sp. PV012]|uniref:bifunctional phosphopantothenoylcysteine decarboxylase/phosphopantothenate--cysteine ligase CoaBC n=1 Tax=Lactobacillus sp. PV012 TaxID=2594494 RepID=UPI002240B963|nr:bifunctional phosphopantothenoylcysteine decarboxylase/phosphopantothenate--cysteine ligase CoaBC [Lactobacillus sp. PV012]QNQ82521.1 bifunctional phosphopantothenoylcysteine decarboxylase/phosphopantothenate--cysteine ligase CoaBC [Lactobacillus sp. PV012]
MKVAVYITGGIAAYKAVYFIRLLQKNGHQVRIAMTQNSKNFIGSQTLAALTKYSVLDDLWSKENESKISHIELADWAQAAVVIPADANIIGKMANGLADDAVSTALLATSASKFIVPAMNVHMWENEAVKRNIKTLKEDGINILEPTSGQLAEGYNGKGRMPEPEQVYQWWENYFEKKLPLKGKRVLVTAGGTREQIDPVRFIGNNSSGKMGIALAQAASQLGAEVDLIYGQISTRLPQEENIKLYSIKSTEELLKKVQALFKRDNILIMAAAPADFRVKNYSEQKIKKKVDVDNLRLELEKTPDILKSMGEQKKQGQIIIGFAAETNNLIENAQKKLLSKNADYIIANDVSQGVFGSNQNKVTILSKKGEIKPLPKMDKFQLAKKLLTELLL